MLENDDYTLETVALDETLSLGQRGFDLCFRAFVRSHIIASFPRMGIPAHRCTDWRLPVPIENGYNYLVLYCGVWIVDDSIGMLANRNHR